MNTTKQYNSDLHDDYLLMRLERIHEAGKTLEHMNPEFEEYQVPISDRYRLILESPFGEEPKIKGAIELFGVR